MSKIQGIYAKTLSLFHYDYQVVKRIYFLWWVSLN